jgi:hypothetical protein
VLPRRGVEAASHGSEATVTTIKCIKVMLFKNNKLINLWFFDKNFHITVITTLKLRVGYCVPNKLKAEATARHCLTQAASSMTVNVGESKVNPVLPFIFVMARTVPAFKTKP